MAIIAQIKVARTRRMSSDASGRFMSLNCIGVKMRLKKRFKRKGSKTTKGISFWRKSIKTFPKEIAIIRYKTLHTGPKTHDGGAQTGFMSSA
jgi:hypothetical protein